MVGTPSNRPVAARLVAALHEVTYAERLGTPYTAARIDLSSTRHASPNDLRGSAFPD